MTDTSVVEEAMVLQRRIEALKLAVKSVTPNQSTSVILTRAVAFSKFLNTGAS